jgi:hypothetical protein
MAERRSRFEQIYRQQTQSGQGTFSALGSAARERAKEKADLRRLFSDKGMLGAILESAFGKAYKYRPKEEKKATETEKENRLDSKELNVIRINTVIAAKNSMVLPGMARDMNVMRQNIVRMTKASTGTAATKADASFMKSKERELSYESALQKKEGTDTKTKASSGQGLFKSIFGGVGSLLGGMGSVIKGTGSIVGSIFSGLSSLVGGVAGGIFKVASSVFGGFGLAGIMLAVLTGSLLTSLYKGLDFGKIGTQFGQVFSFISKSIKSFFGIKDNGDDNNKGFFRQVAEYLDETFKTTGFTDGLNFIIKQWKSFSAEISYQISKLYNNIMVNATAAFQAVGDIFMGIGKDIKSVFYKWLDDNTVGIYTMMGAVVGARFGLRGKALAVALGAATGYVAKQTDEDRQRAVQNIEKEIEGIKYSLSNIPEGQQTSNFNPSVTRKSLEADLKDAEERLQMKKQEIEDRMGSKALAPFEDRFNKYKEEAKLQYPEPKRPVPVSESEVNGMSTKKSPSRILKFSDLTPEQQLIFVREQRKQEGFYPGSASYDMNNPGNLVYSDQAARFGAIQDPSGKRGTGEVKGKLAQFESLAQGEKAQIDLLANGPGYRNLSLDDALKRWTASQKNPEKTANYRANIFAKLQIEHTEAINENIDAINKLNKNMEDKKSATMTEMLAALIQGITGSGDTTVNNVNNTSVSGGGSVASPYNEDMLALFKQRASVGL